MKKRMLMAGLAVCSTVLAGAAFAQDGAFKDVPNDHWAYQAIEKLVAQNPKIFIGDPDGMFRGKRNLTRYEMAVIIARLLENIEANYAKKGDGGPRGTTDLSPYARKSDLAGLASRGDVDAVRKLAAEFQTELTTLGVDLDSIKKRLDALDGRVTKIEDMLKKMPKISGQLNAYGRGNMENRDGALFIDRDGFLVGGAKKTFLNDTRTLHDLDLNIGMQPSEGTSVDLQLNLGNYLSYYQSGVRSNQSGRIVSQDQVLTIWKAVFGTNVNLPILGNAGIEVGRVPVQLTPYTLKRPDFDSYLINDKIDSGSYPLDGVRGTHKFGNVGVTTLLAKVDPIRFVSNINGNFPGDNAYTIRAGATTNPFGGGLVSRSQVIGDKVGSGGINVENLAAAHITVPVGRLNLSGTGMQVAGPGVGSKVNVFGGGVNTNIAGFAVDGSYTISETQLAGGPKVSKNNTATDVAVSRNFGKLGLTGGYRKIDPFFAAPGNWARLGTLQNPVDIKGFYGNASLPLGGNVKLMGGVHMYEGLAAGGGLTPNNEINNVSGGVEFGLNGMSSLMVGAEQTEYKFSGGKPKETYLNVGYGYNFNPASSFRLLYQVVDYKDKGGFGGGNQKGGVVTGTFSVRF